MVSHPFRVSHKGHYGKQYKFTYLLDQITFPKRRVRPSKLNH